MLALCCSTMYTFVSLNLCLPLYRYHYAITVVALLLLCANRFCFLSRFPPSRVPICAEGEAPSQGNTLRQV